MRKLFLLFVLALFSAGLVNAACLDKRACLNEFGDSCLPADLSCSYTKYTDSEGSCVIDNGFTDLNSDSDSWTDGCDAFISDTSEWFDLDADGVGNNADCNDFDALNTDDCSVVENVEENNDDEVSVQSSSSGSSSGRGRNLIRSFACVPEWECGEWSVCENGMMRRSCVDKNLCGSIDLPDEEKECVAAGKAADINVTSNETQKILTSNDNKYNDQIIIPYSSIIGSFGLFALLFLVAFLIIKKLKDAYDADKAKM